MKLRKRIILLLSLTLATILVSSCKTPLEKAAKSLDEVESSLERWGTTSVSRVLLLENKEQFKVDIDGKTSEYVGNAKTEFQGAASRFSERVFESKTSEKTRNINGSDVIDTDAGNSSNLPEKIGVKDTLANEKFKDFLALLTAPSSISDSDALKIGISTKVSENLLKFFTNPKDIPATETAFLGVLQVSCNPGWFTQEDYIGGVIVTPEYAISSEELSGRLDKLITDLEQANSITEQFGMSIARISSELGINSKPESEFFNKFRAKLYGEAKIPSKSMAAELGAVYNNKRTKLKDHIEGLNKFLEEYKLARGKSEVYKALAERIRNRELTPTLKGTDREVIQKYIDLSWLIFNDLNDVLTNIKSCRELLSKTTTDAARKMAADTFKVKIQERLAKMTPIELFAHMRKQIGSGVETQLTFSSPWLRIWDPGAKVVAKILDVQKSLDQKSKFLKSGWKSLNGLYSTLILQINLRFPKGAEKRQDYQTIELYRSEILKAAEFSPRSKILKAWDPKPTKPISYQKLLKELDAKIEKNKKAKESKKTAEALAGRISKRLPDYVLNVLEAELLAIARDFRENEYFDTKEKSSSHQSDECKKIKLKNCKLFDSAAEVVKPDNHPEFEAAQCDRVKSINQLLAAINPSCKSTVTEISIENSAAAENSDFDDVLYKLKCNVREKIDKGLNAPIDSLKSYRTFVQLNNMIESGDPLGQIWQPGYRQPSIQSVFPLVEAQTLDLKNSNRSQIAWANYLSVALASTGYTSQSEQLTEYVNRLQNDFATRTATPVVSAFTTGTSFGYDFQPVFQALGDPTDADSEAAHKLHPSTIPAMVLVLVEKEEQKQWTRVKFNVSSRWRPIEGSESIAWQLIDWVNFFGPERGWFDWSKGKLENIHRYHVAHELDLVRQNLTTARRKRHTHRYREIKRRYTALSNLGQGLELFTKMPPAPTKASTPTPKPITVTNCEPTVCVANRDSYLVIQGTEFKQGKTNNVSRVTVGSIDCKFEVVSASVLVAHVPKDTFNKGTTRHDVVVSGRVNIATGIPTVEFSIEGKKPQKNPQIRLQYNSANKITEILISNIGGSQKEILKALSKIVKENRVSNSVKVGVDVETK